MTFFKWFSCWISNTKSKGQYLNNKSLFTNNKSKERITNCNNLFTAFIQNESCRYILSNAEWIIRYTVTMESVQISSFQSLDGLNYLGKFLTFVLNDKQAHFFLFPPPDWCTANPIQPADSKNPLKYINLITKYIKLLCQINSTLRSDKIKWIKKITSRIRQNTAIVTSI